MSLFKIDAYINNTLFGNVTTILSDPAYGIHSIGEISSGSMTGTQTTQTQTITNLNTSETATKQSSASIEGGFGLLALIVMAQKKRNG